MTGDSILKILFVVMPLEMYALKDQAYPLLERVLLGPLEDEVKIFIMEKHWIVDINEEVSLRLHLNLNIFYVILVEYINGGKEYCESMMPCLQVAQFINLPEAVLFGFLDKYKKDEESEKEIIQEK